MKLNFDSPVLDYINTFLSFVVLNILFLICCIPVVTIGPALCAVYRVTIREVKREYGYMVRTYLKAFREYFLSALLLFVFFLMLGLILLFAAAFWYSMGGSTGWAAVTFLAVVGLAIYGSVSYAFPLLARYGLSLRQTLKNSFAMAMGHPGYTLLLMGIDIAFFIFLYFTDAGKVFMGIVGFSFMAVCKSLVLVKVFEKYETDEEKI